MVTNLYGTGVQTDADGFIINDGSLPTAFNVITGKFEPNPYYTGNKNGESNDPPPEKTPAEILAEDSLKDGGDTNDDGVVDANELDYWRPTDARYGTNPNNGNNYGAAYLDMIRRDGGESFIGDDNFFSEEEFYEWDAFRQKRANDGGKEYIGLTVEGMPNFVDPNTGEREDPPTGDDDPEEEGNWWDSLELSSEGNSFTDPQYQVSALASVEALRYKYSNDGNTEDLANFESWYAAHPSGYGSKMWGWFMSRVGGSGPGGVDPNPNEVTKVLPKPDVKMLGDSSNYTVGDRVDQLRPAVPIPDGGRQATDFELRYDIRNPRPYRPENPFNAERVYPMPGPDLPSDPDRAYRPPRYNPFEDSPFERPEVPDNVAPEPPDDRGVPLDKVRLIARGGVVKPLTGIQTLGR